MYVRIDSIGDAPKDRVATLRVTDEQYSFMEDLQVNVGKRYAEYGRQALEKRSAARPE